MKIELEFLRSKVARRVFTLFVISSLVPVILLSLVSFGQVQAMLTEQKQEAIRQSNKRYGLALLERLLMLDDQLRWLAGRLAAQPGDRGHVSDLSEHLNSGRGFRRVTTLTGVELERPSSTLTRLVRKMATREQEYLADDKGLLITAAQTRLPPKIYLLRLHLRTNQEPVYILGEVERDFLFGDRDVFPLDTQICVLDTDRTPLFCSQGSLDLEPEQLERIAESPSGHFEADDRNGERTLVSYWSIFLKPNFWIDTWTVISRASTANALETAGQFRIVFAAVIGLTLAIVALLSVHQIRRRLIPLERILEGVHRITHRDFSQPVEVASGDELEELASSVNQMASTLDKQFHTLSTLAELDELILSSLKADDIVRVVLTRTSEILYQDLTSMTVLLGPRQAICHTQGRDAHGRETLDAQTLSIDPKEAESLQATPHRIDDLDAQRPPAYLRTLKAFGARRALVLPVLVKEELHAVIVLGYLTEVALPREDIDLARDFANRVAVALTNARWEEQLYYLAHYDALTNLPNRLLLKDRLNQVLASAERHKAFVAVFFIDLDRFKNVNDSLGHVTGDYLLREVGERLKSVLRTEDTVSRLGGDEFVIVIQQLGDDRESLAFTSTIANKLLQELSRPFAINDREIITTASIGIACYPTDGDTANELLKNADAAMYHAKASGKDNFQFYSKILNAEALERLEMESSLRHAIERGELHLAYQPKHDTRTKRICGAEALLRWTHPRQGRISPAQFIPVCEEIGLIVPIGEWIVRSVCSQIVAWTDMGLPAPRIAINLSPVQFRQPDLLATVLGIVAEQGIDPSLLEFEITEGAAMEDIEATTRILREFNACGFHLSIDDFGTGHSSLNYLKQFPIHTLKIDQSFVRHIREDTKDEAIVKSIITLAHSLSFGVVAEGVETDEQFRFLSALDCDVIQGYLFSPPIPPEDFAELLKNAA